MIVADTHALVWWLGAPSRLSSAARQAMDGDSIGVAAISCLEVALLARRNRIELPSPVPEWLDDMIGLSNTELLPITAAVATTAANLWGPLRDPSDLLIVATAIHYGVPLVTKDERIRRAGIVETIW